MSRPDPIQYADRLYAAICAANFSPISFLAFGNAVKDGVALRKIPRMAAEPFMRVVGEMLDLEEEVAVQEVIDADLAPAATGASIATTASPSPPHAERLEPEGRKPDEANASEEVSKNTSAAPIDRT
jgi:hypothetical protein